jgi:nucleoside-diphosphate-sugar epimerase
LRALKLDELPQLWNVASGEMSLVGPRPQVPEEVSRYTAEERRLLQVRPGITDLASIVFADEGAILAGSVDPDLLYNRIIRPWKSRLALLYLERESWGTDARILLSTAGALVSRRWALAQVAKLLARWGVSQQLCDIARRAAPLPAFPPPGSCEVAARAGAAGRIPPPGERIANRTLGPPLREVRVEDLLGRPPVHLEESAIRAGLEDRVVLVTGAGGSIGSELCRQVARYGPAAIVGLDQSEAALYQIDREMRERFPLAVFRAELGSIQNRRRLDEIFAAHQPHAVYHAAAYKHVPLMETHLFEAIENNILGTQQVARAASAAGAQTVVLVSSDKAVRPVNIMGASKRLAELVCLGAAQAEPGMRFLAVRFGNVLGSSGSVIPLFRRQIAAGGPVTVTHPEMRRFLMTVAEAAQLVLQAAGMGAGGEIFALNMGEPVRILELARRLIRLSGLEPDLDIRIEFSGMRPGEKLCEELSAYQENTAPTPHAQIRVFTGKGVAREALARGLLDLRRAVEARDAAAAVLSLKELIPEYNPSAFVLERALGAPAQRALARAV